MHDRQLTENPFKRQRRRTVHINLMFLTFLFWHLSSTSISVINASTPTCYKYFSDIGGLAYFSGELNSTQPLNCSDTCSTYQVVGVTYNTSFQLADLCFCGSNESSEYVTSEQTSSVCASANCTTSESGCQYVGFSYDADIGEYPIVVAPRDAVLDVDSEIEVITESTGITSVVYDFGDGDVESGVNFRVNHAYRTPGWFFLSVGVEKYGSTYMKKGVHQIVHVNTTKPPNVTFSLPEVLEVSKTTVDYLTVVGDLTLKITQRYLKVDGRLKELLEDVVNSDVLVYALGPGISITGNAVAHPKANLVIVPALTFTESGILTAIEVRSSTQGKLAIYILRPDSCTTCNDVVSLMGNGSTSITTDVRQSDTFNVTKTVEVRIPKAGLQTVELQTHDVDVQRGDVISFSELQGLLLDYRADDNVGIKYKKVNDRPIPLPAGENVGSFIQSSPMIPDLRPHVTKLFKFKLEHKNRDELGNVTFTAAQNGPADVVFAQVTVPVQAPIDSVDFTGLSEFIRSEQRTLDVSAIVTPVRSNYRPDVTYEFRIDGLSVNETTNEKDVSFQREYWEPGVYSVHVVARNLIGSANSTKQISILDDIDGLEINPPGEKDLKGREFDLIVRVINGTNVTLDVEFGDAATRTIFIPNADRVNGEKTIKHTYTQCGDYTLKVKAKNSLGEMDKESPLPVYCRITNFQVNTNPTIQDGTRIMKLSIADKLILTISIGAGSHVNYTIDWGDESHDTEISDKFIASTSPLVKKHKYNEVGNFTVRIMVSNAVNEEEESFLVKTQNCTEPPHVNFVYGTEEKRVTFTRGDEMEFLADWTFSSLMCKEKVGQHISSATCAFQNTNLNSILNFEKREDGHACIIKPRALDVGEYLLIFTLTYKQKSYPYKAYLEVQESPLVASIHNGDFQSIPHVRRGSRHAPTAPYLFRIDGSRSKDPDDPKTKLVFRWFCRHVSGNYTRNFCSNETWQAIGDERGKVKAKVKSKLRPLGPEGCTERSADVPGVLKINTTCFVANAIYAFKLNVSVPPAQDGRPGRSAVTEQRIKVEEGDPPQVELKCLTNCQKKVNTMDRLVIGYNCDTCFGRRLEGKWTIKDVKTNTSIPNDDMGSSPNLVIHSNILKDGTEYAFELAVNYVGSERKSVVKLQMATCTRPQNGSCVVTPREGEAVKTKFRAVCKDWLTDDGPQTYEFCYNPGTKSPSSDGEPTYPLLNPSTLSRAEVSNLLLPPGPERRNYTIDFVIRIKNKYGAYATWEKSSVVVKPFSFEAESDESEDNSTGGGGAQVASQLDSLAKSKPSNPNDTQAMTAFVTSAVSVVDAMPLIVEPTDEPKVEDDRFGTFSNVDPAKAEHEKEAKEKKKKEVTQFKQNLVNDLGNLPVKNIQQMQAVSDSLSTVTSQTDEVSPGAKDAAIDILVKMQRTLADAGGDEKVGAGYLEKAATNYVSAISNLLAVGASHPTHEKHEGEATTNATEQAEEDKEANKGLENAEKLAGSLDAYMTVMSEKKVPGEGASKMRTESFSFSLQKVNSNNFANVTVEQDEGEQKGNESYGFKLPNMTSVFEGSGLSDHAADLGLCQVTFKKNIYTSADPESHDVKSEVSALAIKNGDKALNVSNLTEPIIINIKNNPEKLDAKNVTLYLPGDIEFQKKRLTKEQSVGCNMLLNYDFLNDDDNETEFVVLVQYGKTPSSDNFDLKLNISKRHGMIMTVSNTARVFTLANKTMNGSDEGVNRGNKTINCSMIVEGNETTTRTVYAHKIDERTVVMWNFSAYHYALCANLTMYFSYYYNGPMPRRILIANPYTYDTLELRGSFNYSARTFCTECSYWNKAASKWLKDGCALDPVKTSLRTTSCRCNHLTAFGGFFVAPNPLPTPTLGMLKEGFVLLITVATILLLYICGLMVLRKVDNKDLGKIGVCPLMDNNPANRYLYEITVNTGSRRNAGTRSNVFFMASGDICDSDVHHLADPERETFQESNSDVFVMATENRIGDINYIRLWHDNTGGDWYVRNVEVIDLQTEEKSLFICTRWLSLDKQDGMLDCIVPVCGKEELSDFNYLFTNKSKRELSDAHIWFSIYARPPRSSFTRCQRLSVAISMLFCSMLASCMFFGAVPKKGAVQENRIGGFSFTWHQVFIAIISACITVPVNLLLVGLFRVINPVSNSSKINPAASVGSLNETEEATDPSFSPGESRLITDPKPDNSSHHLKKSGSDAKKKRKKAFYLPHWCLYPTWMLCIGVILSSAFLIVWYGMSFGNRKSLDWLASVTICLVQDIILIQPLKVFAMALFIALIVKKLDEEEKSELEKNVKTLSKNESWLHKLQRQETIFDRVEVTEPPDLSVLEEMRGVRLKEMKMAAISREMLLYFIFTMVVFLIGYNMRDEFAYYQTKDVKELLRLKIRDPAAHFKPDEVFTKTQRYRDFWGWADNLLLPQMYPHRWYNLNKQKYPFLYDFPGKIFLNDLSSKLVNGVRLRQMRVKPNSCNMAPEVKPFMKYDCAGSYGILNEDRRDFKYNWHKPYSPHSRYFTFQNKPWRYQDSSQLDTYRIMAKLHSYVGGGYVVELFPKFDNRMILADLKRKQWIDRHTRAVIVEFAVYNANTNYFEMCMIVFEFPPSGGIVHYSSVETFRLSLYTKETQFFVITSFALYLLFMLVFTIREARILYRVGWSYFRDFWNLVEMGNVLLSIVGLFFYFYLNVLRKRLLSKLPHKVPNVFINFHLASIWYDCLIHIVALICFFVTLKFIKILRFNKRISMLSSTLKVAWYPLAMFGIMFAIILAAVIFSATIIFGHMLYGYRNWWGTTSAVFSLLLGKFSYEQFESTNRILGPIFFFSFNIMINWIIMNMFISILNDVFASVQAEILQQENEYEMLDYIMGHLKSWLGFKHVSSVDKTEKTTERLESTESDVNESRASLTSGKERERESRASMTSRNTSRHWNRAEKLFVDDSHFLKEEEVSEEFIAETVEKFTKCINLLYFKDSAEKPKSVGKQTKED